MPLKVARERTIMSDFDAIVVGAGCAGTVAAYELAKAGKSVLLVERGNYAGAKNMTGGRIYSHALKAVFPDFEENAPWERKVTHERISMLSPDADFTVDFASDQMLVPGADSYTVLRGPFDRGCVASAFVLRAFHVLHLHYSFSGALRQFARH